MTNLITLTIPNDDHIALRAFGKALEEMALAHGAEPRKTIGELSYKLNIDTTDATETLERLNDATGELMQAAPHMPDELRFEGEGLHGKRKEPEVDTTAQQVESLVPRDGRSIEVTREMVELCIPVKPDIDPPTTDSTGTPWDERIHSTSKALNADGTWRLRRKPKDMGEEQWAAFVESIKNELMGIDAQDLKEFEESKQAILEPPVTPPGDDFHTDTGVVTEQTVAGIPPIPVPPPVVVAPPVPEVTEWDFPRLMTFLTERHGKIDVTTVNTLLAQDGMSSVQELNAHPDKIGLFVARVKAHLGE
jgi:hypothetical protein|nr:MAG TPA: hypothetical protein [Caudoviricetes sp.]